VNLSVIHPPLVKVRCVPSAMPTSDSNELNDIIIYILYLYEDVSIQGYQNAVTK